MDIIITKKLWSTPLEHLRLVCIVLGEKNHKYFPNNLPTCHFIPHTNKMYVFICMHQLSNHVFVNVDHYLVTHKLVSSNVLTRWLP